MTNEQLIATGDTAPLWDSLYRFTHQQAYRFHTLYADKCTSAGVTFEDLVQQSYIIMVNAAQLYKPDTYRFITYYGKALIHGYLRLIRKSEYIISLDKPIDADSDDTLADITPNPNGEDDIDNVIEAEYQRELSRDIQRVLDTLPDLEHDVIHERFWNSKTLQEVADNHDMTAQEAKNVEDKAMRDMRKPKAMAILKPYRQDIINRYAYYGSLEQWRSTHTSSTERTVFKL